MSRMLSLPWNDGTASGQMGVEADRVALVLWGEDREGISGSKEAFIC